VEAAGAAGRLAEAAAVPWRRRASETTLRREGRKWTLWTAGVLATFGGPAAVVVAIEPLTAPVAAIFLGHGLAVLHLQAGRGARAVVPIGSERSASRRARAEDGPERVAMGLLGDLLGHEERDLVARTGLALQRGRLGTWLVGEEGALMVRPGGRWVNGGRRVDCWCVRVGDAGDLPAGDRVAHLLLALREDEAGFATVSNFNFSGAFWRVRLRTAKRSRPALDAARAIARD
jgi:hypothetical protein